MTLLTKANLPHDFLTFAFKNAVYLINCMLTATLKRISPFQKLYNKPPNYINLQFLDVYAAQLKPYTHHKLESYSKPCILLGYLPNQSGLLMKGLLRTLAKDRTFHSYLDIFSLPRSQAIILFQMGKMLWIRERAYILAVCCFNSYSTF